GSRHQLERQLQAVGVLEVHRDVALAPLAAHKRTDDGAAHAVAPGGLDLDHVGAEVGEQHRAEWAGQVLPEVAHPHPLQRSGHDQITPFARRSAKSVSSWPIARKTSSVWAPANGCGPRTSPRVCSRKMVMPPWVVGPTSGSTTSATPPDA